MNISKNGFLFCMERDSTETNKQFFDRTWILINQNPIDKETFEKANTNSYIWSNITNKRCKYIETVQSRINKLSVNITS